jgi:hypothetical protein
MGLLYGRAGRLTAQNGGFRRGQAGRVRIAGTAGPAAKVQFSMDYSCGEGGGGAACGMSGPAERDAMLAEMAELLGVPARRLRIAGVVADADVTAPPTPTPSPLALEDVRRIPGQFSGRRRQQEAEKARRQLREEGAAQARRDLKRQITSALLEYFKSPNGERVPKDEQRAVLKVLLTPATDAVVLEAWDMYKSAADAVDIAGFVSAILLTF